MAFNKDFYKLFLIKEGKELAGKQMKNVLALFAILLMTFLSIGFGEGGLDYLEVKMSSPFYKWVNIRLPDTKSDSASILMSRLENDTLMSRYHYTGILTYAHFNERFFNTKGEDIPCEGRIIEANDSLLKGIWDECLIKGKKYDEIDSYFGKRDYGLIVSQDFLIKLGYDDLPSFLYLYYPLYNEKALKVPLPVVAVVKQLPGMVSMMSTPLFYYETSAKQDYSFDISKPEYQKYLRYFLPATHDTGTWHKKVKGEINKRWPGILKNSYTAGYSKSMVDGNLIQFNLASDSLNNKKITANDLDDLMTQSLAHKVNPLIRIYDYQFGSIYREEIKPDYLSVYFSNMDSITQFQLYIERKLDLKIELSQVDSKNNFNFISKLTKITSFILIIFSILSVSMFLSNLIRSHFERVKKNIGTFKAFGLNNHRLLFIYTAISFVFALIASSAAYSIAFILGYSGSIKMILGWLQLTIEKSYLIFNLLTEMALYTFLVVITLSTLIVLIQLKKLLAYTPGDLIYDRK